MVWFDLDDVGVSPDEFVLMGKEKGLRFLGARLVVHYQICDEAVGRLTGVLQVLIAKKGAGKGLEDREVGIRNYG